MGVSGGSRLGLTRIGNVPPESFPVPEATGWSGFEGGFFADTCAFHSLREGGIGYRKVV